MTKKSREEPKFRIEEFENDNKKTVKKQWPIDEQDNKDIDEDIAQETTVTSEIAGILDHPSYKELENKLTALENEYLNHQLRAKAEVENVRRRAERDVFNERKYALEKYINDLLPVIDSLDRALESKVSENVYAQKIHEGIELTMSMFLKVMEKYGVKIIDPQGEMFNPELHQAISTQSGQGVSDNTILNVLQKGFTLNDRLLRPALVVVAKS